MIFPIVYMSENTEAIYMLKNTKDIFVKKIFFRLCPIRLVPTYILSMEAIIHSGYPARSDLYTTPAGSDLYTTYQRYETFGKV